MGPLGTFQPGMNPWLPQGFGQQPPGTRPGFPPPMPAGTTSAPPFGGMNPRIGPSGSFGGAVETITDQIMNRLFGGGAPEPGSNMPRTSPPWGGPNAGMGAMPQFDRQGNPMRPPMAPPPGPMPPGLPQMPPDASRFIPPPGGFGGPDARMGPAPPQPGMPGPMPQVPPGGLGGPNAAMSAMPQFNRQGIPMRPEMPPPPGPAGPSMQERMMDQYGTHPLTGQPLDGPPPGPPQLAGGPPPQALTSPSRGPLMGGPGQGSPWNITEPNAVAGARWGGVPSPTVGRGGAPQVAGGPGGAGRRGVPPELLGMDIDPTIGPGADFLSLVQEEIPEDGELKPPADPFDRTKGKMRGFAKDFGVEEQQRPVMKETALGAFMKGLADGLPGALVAFAADRANSPELAQQYSQMKARELSEVQDRRRAEIENMRDRAEQSRHLASLGMQQLDRRFNLEKNAQELQEKYGTGDPAKFSSAMNALAELYATTGADPQAFRDAHPFLDMERFRAFREEATKLWQETAPENMGSAIIQNPWTQQWMTVPKALELTRGLTPDGKPIQPNYLGPTTEVSETGPDQIKRTRTVSVREARGMKPQITHPDPNYSISFGSTDPETGYQPVVRSSGRFGTADIIKQLPGTQTGMAAELGQMRRLPVTMLVDTEVRNFMRENNGGVEPLGPDVAAAKQNPKILEIVRQRLVQKQQATQGNLPNIPTR